MDHRSPGVCRLDVGDDATLGGEETPFWLEDGHVPQGQAVPGESGSEGLRVQHLVVETVDPARLQRAAEHLTRLGAGVHGPGDMDQILPGLGLQVVPQLESPPHQGDVGGVLVVGETEYPVHPVRRAVLVGDVVLLQSQHPAAASCEVMEGGAPHRPHADDDHVVEIGDGHETPDRAAACYRSRPVTRPLGARGVGSFRGKWVGAD